MFQIPDKVVIVMNVSDANLAHFSVAGNLLDSLRFWMSARGPLTIVTYLQGRISRPVPNHTITRSRKQRGEGRNIISSIVTWMLIIQRI